MHQEQFVSLFLLSLIIFIAGKSPSVRREDIYEYLGFSYYSEGDYKKALFYTDLLIELDPDHPRAAGNKEYYIEYLETTDPSKNKKGLALPYVVTSQS